MREYVRQLLEPAWDVEVVTNGREAWSPRSNGHPDLVITDVMMPESMASSCFAGSANIPGPVKCR